MEAAFALLDALGLDAVDEREDLALEAEELSARLAETPVLVGKLSHGGELFGSGREVSRTALATVGQDCAGMEFAVGAVAGGFSTSAAESIKRAGEDRLSAEEGFQQGGELLLEVLELPSQGAEVVGHGEVRGV